MSVIPTLGLYLKTCEIQFQFVANGSLRRPCRCWIGIAGNTAFVKSVVVRRNNESIVTAANYLVKNNHLIVEVDGRLTISNHTTYVTSAVERTKLGGIREVSVSVTT